MRLLAIIAIVLLPSFASGQQQLDSATLQRLLAAVEQQRNNALNQAAFAEARVVQLAEEVQRLKAEMEKQKPQ
jgi:hypothetical protein